MNWLSRLLALGLRMATLGGKLLLLLVMARFFGPGDIAVFGLISAATAYGSFVAGLEFYNHSMRAIATVPAEERSRVLASHAIVVAVGQVALGCVALALVSTGTIPAAFFLVAIILTLIEHWAQEGYRMLVALARPVSANISLFLRQGLWVMVALVAIILVPESRNLEFVLWAWVFGVGSSCVWSGVAILQLTKGQRFNIDRIWIRQGLPVALIFFAASFGLRSISFLDRYFQAYLGNESALAAYVLFGGIATSLVAVLDAGVFSFALPAMLLAGTSGKTDVFKTNLVQMAKVTLGVCVCFGVSVVVFGQYGLTVLDMEFYLPYLPIFYALAVANIFMAVSMVFHIGLYALGQDRSILAINLATLAIFVLATWLFSGLQEYAVAAALMFSLLFVMAAKAVTLILTLRGREHAAQ